MFLARPALSPRFCTESGSSPRNTFAGSAGDSTFRPKFLSDGWGRAHVPLTPADKSVRPTLSTIELRQQFIRPPHMRNHDAAAYHQRHVDCLFLLGAGHAQAIGLNHVVVDAVVATQTGGGYQAHQ